MSLNILLFFQTMYSMNNLRQMLPQIWPQGYKRVDSSSSLEDAVTLEKSSPSLQLLAKRLLRLPLKTILILIAALLIFPGLIALTFLKVSRENSPQRQY